MILIQVNSFYILLKVHNTAKFPPGRLIISACIFALELISKYIDFYLQPFVSKAKSYVRDTKDFIMQLEGMEVPENAILITLDITSLYINIPLNETRLCLKNILEKQGPDTPNTYSFGFHWYYFEHNYFKFEGNIWRQKCGVAIGSSFALNVANIFMTDFEETFIFYWNVNPFLQGRFDF